MRPGWIGLAIDGPLMALADQARIVGDAAAFMALLDHARPRIAIVSEPPASSDLLDQLAYERRRRPRLRIVYLSADDAVESRLDALRRGFDAALPSTIEPDELTGRLTLLDEGAHSVAGTAIEIADGLELDLIAHELRRDGATVHLRPKEFQLLSMLAGHPGRVYSRRQLLDRVWGQEHDGDPRTVDVHIRWLRSKIERDPSRPILVTLRGIGYRLDPPDR
jgi:DNA-binding response OmpR family regulator